MRVLEEIIAEVQVMNNIKKLQQKYDHTLAEETAMMIIRYNMQVRYQDQLYRVYEDEEERTQPWPGIKTET